MNPQPKLYVGDNQIITKYYLNNILLLKRMTTF